MEPEASNQLAPLRGSAVAHGGDPQDRAASPSHRLRLIQILSSVNVYGLFFGTGLAIANISRLFPYGGAIYAVGMISIIGLSVLKAEVDAQKLIILAVSISAIAFWDALIQFLFQPIFLGFWIIPLWQCLIYGIGSLMMLIGLLYVVKAEN